MVALVRSASSSLAHFSVAHSLKEDVYAFDFAQSVRILHSLYNTKPFVGSTDDPSHDPVFFRGQISFGVSSSEIHKLTVWDIGQAEMTVSFTGIAGIQGPLPDIFSEILVERIKAKDFAARDFLDLFNHRLITFWYMLHVKLFPSLRNAPMESTEIGESLLDLGGVRRREGGETMLPFGPLFWESAHSAIGLEGLITEYFHLPCRIKPFEGHWNQVDVEEQTSLGRRFHCLGQDAILGNKTYDQGGGFRLVLGPLTYLEFQDFLPSDDTFSGFCRLRSLVNAYFDSPPIYTLELILNQREVPPAFLGQEKNTLDDSVIQRPEKFQCLGSQLQRNAWLNIRKNIRTHGRVELSVNH